VQKQTVLKVERGKKNWFCSEENQMSAIVKGGKLDFFPLSGDTMQV